MADVDPAKALKDFEPKHEFFVGIDSDGCAFDTMGIKQRECLEKIRPLADAIVVSATPCEALTREWEEHDIAKYVEVIAGQEMGKKAQHLKYATRGRYEKNHVLMVGDAPGDMKAAKANDALFYPINPGDEVKSWKRFGDEAFDKFINGEYAGEYEEKLMRQFDTYLPELPPWEK